MIGQSQITYKNAIRIADDMFAKKDYYGAALYYNKAMLLDSSDVQLWYKLAEAYRGYNDYPKAAYYYLKVYKKDKDLTLPFGAFYAAQMFKSVGNYKYAYKYFKRSKRAFRKDKKGYYYQKVLQEIKSAQWAKQHINDKPLFDWKHINTPINSYSSDFAGTFLNDTVFVFSSLRDEKMKDDYVITDTLVYLSALYKAKFTNDDFTGLEKLSANFDLNEFHIANASLSPDKKTLYFSVCNRKLKCKIYGAVYINGKWQQPFEIKEVNTNEDEFTTTQPFSALINGREVLFFVSDRKGGKGMLDIWKAEKDDFGKFSMPENLKNINTPDNDITPFYNTKTDELFFSSTWYYGFGGYDVFKTPDFTNDTVIPENLGITYNSPANDLYFNQYNNKLSLTSNRKGGLTKKGKTCCNDLYYYIIPQLDTITQQPVFTNLEQMNRYLPLSLYFHNDEPNPRTRDTTTNLTYEQTYLEYIKLEKEYRKEFSKGLSGEEKEDAELEIEDFFEQYVQQGMQYLQEFTPLLLKELEQGKHVTLTIKGYASPLSKSDYNVNLTLRRIQSLINYLQKWQNGKLLPYFLGASKNGGKLDIVKVPYGEYNSDQSVSDRLEDKRNSVYSPKAALQRKIEIIAVTSEESKVSSFSNDTIKNARLKVEQTIYAFGDRKKINVLIENTGNEPLQIFNVLINCENCMEISWPENFIQPGETANLYFEKNTTFPTEGVKVEIISNAVPSREYIQINP
jgi:hypothetical protein